MKYATPADLARASQILDERRLRDPNYRPPSSVSKFFTSKASQEKDLLVEVSRAFRAAIQENASLDLIEAFLEFGACVCIRPGTPLWKKTKSAHRDGSDTLRVAVRSGSVDLVSILAAHADQTSLDEALADAIHRQDTSKSQALFDEGADVRVLHSAICQAAARFDVRTLEYLGT